MCYTIDIPIISIQVCSGKVIGDNRSYMFILNTFNTIFSKSYLFIYFFYLYLIYNMHLM